MIYLDDRGKLCQEMARKLPKHEVKCEVTRLEEGDACWADKDNTAVFAELKTAEDLVNSLVTGHMQDQESRMLELEGLKIVLVAGRFTAGYKGQTLAEHQTTDSWDRGYRRNYTVESFEETSWRQFSYPYQAVTNYLARLQEFGFMVVQVMRGDAANALAGVYKRSMKGTVSIPKRRVAASMDHRARALKCLPEFKNTPVKAVEALVKDYWQYPLKRADINELLRLEGVGRTTAKKVVEGMSNE